MTELWLQLINAETEEEFKMLSDTGIAPIQKALFVVHEMSEDEKIQELARLREKALHDEVTALDCARREGIEQGIEQGIEKGRKDNSLEIARKMLRRGRTVEEICEDTGLAAEDIAHLIKQKDTTMDDLL